MHRSVNDRNGVIIWQKILSFFIANFLFSRQYLTNYHWYSWTIWFLKTLYHIIELFSIFASFLWQKHNNRCIIFRGKVSEWAEFVCDGWKCSDFSKPSITLKLFSFQKSHYCGVFGQKNRTAILYQNYGSYLVGNTGFEPAASSSRTKRATKLR